MKRGLFFSIIAALVLLAAPAFAGNVFVAADVAAEANDVNTDDLSGAFRVGWDFGTPTLAVEYNLNKSAGDTLFLNGGLDFGKGAFQPGIGAGVGVGVGAYDDQYLQLSGGVMYYFTDNIAVEARYRWISNFDDVSDGDGQYLAGVRLDF